MWRSPVDLWHPGSVLFREQGQYSHHLLMKKTFLFPENNNPSQKITWIQHCQTWRSPVDLLPPQFGSCWHRGQYSHHLLMKKPAFSQNIEPFSKNYLNSTLSNLEVTRWPFASSIWVLLTLRSIQSPSLNEKNIPFPRIPPFSKNYLNSTFVTLEVTNWPFASSIWVLLTSRPTTFSKDEAKTRLLWPSR